MILVLLYSTWLAAAISLGHWPRPSRDDPKYINSVVSFLHTATAFAFLFAFLGLAFPVASLIIDFISPAWYRRHIRWNSALLFGMALLSFAILSITLKLEPGRVMDWFMD